MIPTLTLGYLGCSQVSEVMFQSGMREHIYLGLPKGLELRIFKVYSLVKAFGKIWVGLCRQGTKQAEAFVTSESLQQGCRMIHAGVHCFFGWGLEDRHVPTFWFYR